MCSQYRINYSNITVDYLWPWKIHVLTAVKTNESSTAIIIVVKKVLVLRGNECTATAFNTGTMALA
jgi:hypothetical protein